LARVIVVDLQCSSAALWFLWSLRLKNSTRGSDFIQ
jgi:hypothetical protein